MAELRARLRQATAPLHEQVDTAFSGFAFEHPGDYRQFLRAHCRVLSAAEIALENAGIAELLGGRLCAGRVALGRARARTSNT